MVYHTEFQKWCCTHGVSEMLLYTWCFTYCSEIDQMEQWSRASASGSVDLGFDSESGQTNDFKIGIHSFSV